ncbi:MAG: cytochrome c oxidase subunit I [Pseudomonadota bacterium]
MPRGWRRWTEVNNSAVGIWYTATAFAFFLFAGVLALLMRTQLAVPENRLFDARSYDQMYSLHGSVMMFLFAVPIFEAFAILMLPNMVGARDLPFPRLSAYGFWSFLIGGGFVCGSIFFGAAPTSGWFMYPPLATRYTEGLGSDIWLLGLSFVEVAALAAAVELIVGVLRCRAPGMRINLMPLYAWYMLVVGGMILFGFPPLIVGDLLFELERAFDWPFFDAERGGDPLLWQHLFWIFGHPEVYIIFLPAIALIAMIVPTFARSPVVGYSWVVLAAVGTGFLSFGLWVHHMYTTGMPGVSLAFFSAASLAVAIPTGVQIFCFIATVAVGRYTHSVPMLFAGGALAIFVIGGLTGVMVAVAPFDFQAHDTYFVVAHLHHVLIGGMVFPVMAGIYYYLPAVSGRLLSERLGRIAFWLMFVGFNVAFLPMHLSGLAGMVRRIYTYGADQGLDTLNLMSTIGAYGIAAGILVFLCDVAIASRRGPRPSRNPWDAGTLEWITPLPAPTWSLSSIPTVRSRYPLWDQPELVREVDEGRGYLPDAEEGQRETLITGVVDARPLQCLRVPGASALPMAAAVFTGGAFIVSVYHWWYATLVCAALATGMILVWLWTGTALIPEKPGKDVGRGLRLPLYRSGSDSAGWWGLFIAMIGDMAALASLLFAYYYFWTVHTDFPPQKAAGPVPAWLGTGAAGLLAAWLLAWVGREWNRRGRVRRFRFALLAAALCCIGGGAALYLSAAPLDPTAQVYPAVVWVTVAWNLLHAGIGFIMLLYCAARSLAGRLTPEYDIDSCNTVLYWHFMAVTVVLSLGTLGLFPLVA